MTIVERILSSFACVILISSSAMGVVYPYLEDVDTDPPPNPNPGMILTTDKFPKISLSETAVNGTADRYAKYNLVVFRGNNKVKTLMRDVKALNPNVIALKYTHPVEYIANSKAPAEFPFTGSGPFTDGKGKVYAGHWLYKAGKKTTASMSATAKSVTVSNAGSFKAGQYAVIYDPPVGSFKNAEQVKISSKSGNKLTFSIRGYKSTAKPHPVNSIVAAHDLGQGGAAENWRYNMSTQCPLDGKGKQFNEVEGNWWADNLLLDGYPTGVSRPDRVDGIEFDADQGSVPDSDVDNNLVVDHGYLNNKNVWAEGVQHFYQILRTRHPDKYIIGGAHDAMGFDQLNGNQMESWPSNGRFQVNPHYIVMDGYLSRTQFQLRHRHIGPVYIECLSKTPSPSYPDPAPKGAGPKNHRAHRFHFGLALLDNGYYVEARHGGPGVQDFWYDEYSVNVTVPVSNANFGKSIHGKTGSQSQLRQHSQWLGKALDDRRRIYGNSFASSNNKITNNNFEANKNGWIGNNVTLSRATVGTFQGKGSLHASKMNKFNRTNFGGAINSPTFSVVKDKEYTVCWALKASEVREFSAKVGSQLSQVVNGKKKMFTPKFNAGPKWVRYVLTFKATSTKSNEKFTIGIGEHNTEVWVDEVYVFEGNANVFRRDFENGIVVVNATHKSKTIQLGGTFKRIKGFLDTTNNGQQLSAITLPAFDSAVLVRMNAVSPPPVGKPTAPSNLSASASSDTEISLSWLDQSNNEDSFQLQRKTGSGNFSTGATLSANTTSYADVGLTANTSYTYRIRAGNSSGFSTFSNTSSATTNSAPPGGGVPAAPSGLSASAVSDTVIDLAWVDNGVNELDFKLQRKTGSGSYSTIATLPANTTSYRNTGLTANTAYTYRIRARNGSGFSTFSNASTATTLSPLPAIPNPPTSLAAATVSDTQINLTWLDNANNEDDYKLQRKIGSGSFVLIATLNANATSFQDTGLTAGTSCTYRIRARNAAGFSTFSNQATATTASAPSAPTSLSATVGTGAGAATVTTGTQVDLVWVDTSNNEQDFRIQRKTGAGIYALIATLPANTTTYSDTGLMPGETYTYRVRARNASGFSPFTNEASVTIATVPDAPANLTSAVVLDTQIDLSWADMSSDEDDFRIQRKSGAGTYGVIAILPANTVSYSDTGLTPGVTYTYRVRGRNAIGFSLFSNESSAKTTSVPDAPTNLTSVAPIGTEVNLSWVDASDNEDDFRVQRKSGSGTFKVIKTIPANSTSYKDTSVTAGITYVYRVRARNASGFSLFTNESIVTTVNAPPSVAPIVDQVVDEGSAITVSISATDVENDPIILSADLPPWGRLTDNGDGTGTIVLDPKFAASGVYTITVSGDDGVATGSTSFNLTVNNINRAPVLSAISNQTVEEGGNLQVNITAIDPDVDDILTLSTPPGLPLFSSLTDNGDGTGYITFSPSASDLGTYPITVTVDDGNQTLNTDSEVFLLTVEESSFYYENDFSATGSVAGDFAGDTADWTSNGDKLVRATANKFRRLHLNTAGASELTDYIFEVDLKTITPNGGYNTAAVMVRYVNKNQFYQVQVKANGDLVIRKKNSKSSWTILNATTNQPYAPVANRNIILAIDVYGSSPTNIDVYVDGASSPTLSATDSSLPYTQGPPAFETKNAPAVEFDNMRVYEGSLPLYGNDFESGVLMDDFTIGLDSPSNWTISQAGHVGEVYSDIPYRRLYLTTANASTWTDYIVSSDMHSVTPGTSGSDVAFLLVRCDPTDTRNYYGVYIKNGDNNIHVVKRTNGTWDWGLGRTTTGDYDATLPHKLTVHVYGSNPVNIDVYYNNSSVPNLRVSDTVSPHAVGGPGFENRATVATWDNFIVE